MHSVTRIMWSVLVLLLAVAPFVVGPVGLGRVAQALYLGVAIMGLNLLTGMTGQISIGHGAFMGVGAYTSVLFVEKTGGSWWVALVLAVAISGVVGLVAGIPALRIRGMYLAMATLGVGIVFPQIVVRYADFTGGTPGYGVTDRLPTIFSNSAVASNYWILLILTLLVFLLVRNFAGSRLGRGLRAVRDHELVAGTFGINVRKTKVLAYGVSAAIAGAAGWMFAVVNQFVSPADFSLTLSINLLLAMVVGGSGTIAGPLIGGFFLVYATEWIPKIGIDSVLTPFVFGALLIAALYFLPRGLAGGITALVDIVRSRHRSTEPAHPPKSLSKP